MKKIISNLLKVERNKAIVQLARKKTSFSKIGLMYNISKARAHKVFWEEMGRQRVVHK